MRIFRRNTSPFSGKAAFLGRCRAQQTSVNHTLWLIPFLNSPVDACGLNSQISDQIKKRRRLRGRACHTESVLSNLMTFVIVRSIIGLCTVLFLVWNFETILKTYGLTIAVKLGRLAESRRAEESRKQEERYFNGITPPQLLGRRFARYILSNYFSEPMYCNSSTPLIQGDACETQQ